MQAAPSRRRPDEPGALVLGCSYLALGLVRSLGRRGVPVWVLRDNQALAAVSRYAARSLPWPWADESRQIDYLLEIGARYRLDGWALLPLADDQAALIARHHAVLAQRFRLTTPPWETVNIAYDKRQTYALAQALDVDYPRTYYPKGSDDVAALDCAFPVLLKPAVKRAGDRFSVAKAWRIDDRQQLRSRYDEACALIDPRAVMVQELIPGDGEAQFSYTALCRDGEVLASLIARRTRQYPVEIGQTSTFVETVSRPELESPARRILAAMRYTGLVEIEFKRDARNGRYNLLDINARTWAWHTLGARAGVDFPYLLWCLVNDKPVPPSVARVGVGWIRMTKDVLAAGQQIRQGTLTPRAYLRSLFRPLEGALFAADDPLPGLLELPLLIYGRLAGRS